jgi:hypothetical protein
MSGKGTEKIYAIVRCVKARHAAALMSLKNVVGVGIGKKEGSVGEAKAWVITVYVEKKVALSQLDPKDRVPSELEGVPTKVLEIGSPIAYPRK